MDFKKSDLPCADMAVWAVSLNVFWGFTSVLRGTAALDASCDPRAPREEKGAGPAPDKGINDDPFDRSEPVAGPGGPIGPAGPTAVAAAAGEAEGAAEEAAEEASEEAS